jgi:hypothetical protein
MLISSLDMKKGRPYPYMIHKLVKDHQLVDIRKVAKVGGKIVISGHSSFLKYVL